MKRSFLNNTVILIAAISVCSCKARKPSAPLTPPVTTTAPVATIPETASGELNRKITAALFTYSTLSLKAKAELSFGNNSNNVNMTIRMQKDKAIWISITAIAGIEAARALITPDSIRIINRLEGLYTAKPFNYIYRFANRQLDFQSLEALLTGNPLPQALNSRENSFETAGNTIRMTGSLGNLIYLFTFNPEDKLMQDNLKDAATGQTLEASYNDFQELSSSKLPADVRLRSDAGNKTVSVSLRYNSVTVNEPLELPFSVPKKYTVTD